MVQARRGKGRACSLINKMSDHSSSSQQTIYPIILSGGAGKRLWPLSTVDMPKQFHALYSDKPIIVETALRVRGDNFANPTIICNESHRFHVASIFQDYGIELNHIILEPCGRDTAAAIATAVHHVTAQDPDGIILILPSDHYIDDAAAFHDHMMTAAQGCDNDAILTFGIEPTHPETGYGYIHRGQDISDGFFRVENFVEKPDSETAERYLAEGDFYWNSGMFMASVNALSQAFVTHAPSVWDCTYTAYMGAITDLDFLRLDTKSFEHCKAISFDYAVMEKLDGSAVVYPLAIEWNDLGSWSALWDVSQKDTQGNAVIGDVVGGNNENCYIRNSNDRSLAVMGLSDMVVISSQNAVTVAHRDHVQDIRGVYEAMIADDCPSTRSAIKRAPWGYSKTIKSNDHFAAKEVVINPRQKTARQIHNHRSEHWVVLEGQATFIIDGQEFSLSEGQSIAAMPGVQHAIENRSDGNVKVFEVQSGDVKEDDVLRVYNNNHRQALNKNNKT